MKKSVCVQILTPDIRCPEHQVTLVKKGGQTCRMEQLYLSHEMRDNVFDAIKRIKRRGVYRIDKLKIEHSKSTNSLIWHIDHYKGRPLFLSVS